MGLVDIIKYEGDSLTFISKYPGEDFNTGAQLIVHESQEALFFCDGRALDLFGPGRHELQTQNLPLLSGLVNLPSGGKTPFHSEVYFVNLVEQMGIPWGTNSKIQYIDPELDIPLQIGASGEMAIAVCESRKLLMKLVGTDAILSQARLIGYFKGFVQTRVKTVLANLISQNNVCIFDVDLHLAQLSKAAKAALADDFSEYGLELTQFLVTNVVKPEGEPIYEKCKELRFRQFADVRSAQIAQQTAVISAETAARQKVIAAKANAEKRQVEGYTYQQERGFDVAEKVAQNDAVGQFSNMGVGLGVMAGVSGTVGASIGNAVSQAMPDYAQPVAPSPSEDGVASFCSGCGYRFADQIMRFCPQCGTRRS